MKKQEAMRRAKANRHLMPTPEKLARDLLDNAVWIGRMKKPERCGICNMKKELTGYQKDCSKPFQVQWLCPRCYETKT